MTLTEDQKDILNAKFEKQYAAGMDVAYGSLTINGAKKYFRRFNDEIYIDQVPWPGY